MYRSASSANIRSLPAAGDGGGLGRSIRAGHVVSRFGTLAAGGGPGGQSVAVVGGSREQSSGRFDYGQ